MSDNKISCCTEPRDDAGCDLHQYRIVRYKDRPAIALPCISRKVKLACLRRCRPNTFKRAVFRSAVSLVVAIRLDGLLLGVVESTLCRQVGFAFDAWFAHIRDILNESNTVACVIWPPELGRKRIYVHVVDMHGKERGFAKVALGAENGSALEYERTMLESVLCSGGETFHVPSLLAYGACEGCTFIIVEPVPQAASDYSASKYGFPSKAVAELAGPVSRELRSALERQEWWRRSLDAADQNASFWRELDMRLEHEHMRLCRVHGDFGPGNLLWVGDRLWIIDWENSCENAPFLTDHVSFFLGTHRKQVHRNPRRMLDRVFELSQAQPDAKRIDLMLALAFLHGVKFTLASRLIEVWNQND